MNRKHHISLCTILLLLLPALTCAQTLNGYEYWFDDNVGDRQWKSLSGTDTEINVSIDASLLEDGIHKFSFRAKQSDGKYSAVTSSLFMKMPSGKEATRLEYWVDGDLTTRKYINGESVAQGGYIINDSLDLSDIEPGVHRLFMRGRSDDNKVVSSVTSVPIYVKRLIPQENKVVYWIDDNDEQKDSISFDNAVDVNSLDLDLADNTKYPVGFHRLNMKVLLEGLGESAVYANGVFKSPVGTATNLEYWVDGDLTTRNHIPCNDQNGEYVFNNSLDLSNLASGVHNLYMRGRSSDGKTVSSVTSVPIMVKSRYNNDPANANMSYYSIAVDEEEPVDFSFPHPGNVVDMDHLFDTRYLTRGNHQLKLKLANTLGAAVNVQQAFTVVDRTEPTVVLSALEKNGLVSIRFNSIPNDNGYRIYRVDANGAFKVIRFEKVSRYPTEICYTDNPPAGTYIYYAKSAYTDLDGNNRSVKSNEVNVTTSELQTTLGYVEGEIYYDGKRKVGHKSNIYFSDGVVVQSNEDGVFRRDRIPVGTELSVYLIENEYYTSDVANVTIAEGRNYARVNANKRFEYLINNQVDYGNLAFAGRITWEPGAYFVFPISNSSHETWNGKLCVKAIPKKYDVEEIPSIGFDDAQVLPGSVAPLSFAYTINYQLFYSEDFQLVHNDYKEVVVPLTGFHNSGPTELFNFYVYCIKTDGSNSLVWPNHRYDTTRNNPIEHMVEGGLVNEDKVTFFTNLILYYCSTVKEVDKLIGYASDYHHFKKEQLLNDYYYLTNATEESQLESEEMKKIVEQMIKECDRCSGEVKSFRDNIAPVVRECKSILELWGYVKKGVKAVKEYKELSSMNDYKKSIYLSKKIIELTEDIMDVGNPFTPILAKYLDITETVIEKVLYLGWAYNQPWIPLDMHDNKLKVKIKILKKDGGSINFKLLGNHIIDYVLVKGCNNSNDDIVEARFKNVSGNILDWHCAVFEQEGTDNISKLDVDGATPFKQLWAEIYWRNGRISYIPLTEIGNGVSYEHAEQSNSIFTITFQSAINDYGKAADVIHLIE